MYILSSSYLVELLFSFYVDLLLVNVFALNLDSNLFLQEISRTEFNTLIN
tara:strand:+ start:51480 stop:51629 length:150 start_codon:yes stop_codon:yes gene_type:complete